jgi:hypothetical protein
MLVLPVVHTTALLLVVPVTAIVTTGSRGGGVAALSRGVFPPAPQRPSA